MLLEGASQRRRSKQYNYRGRPSCTRRDLILGDGALLYFALYQEMVHSYTLPYIRRRCTPIHCLILGDGALPYIALYYETVYSHTLPYIRRWCTPIHYLILADGALLYIALH